jgi:hypothetical protein
MYFLLWRFSSYAFAHQVGIIKKSKLVKYH